MAADDALPGSQTAAAADRARQHQRNLLRGILWMLAATCGLLSMGVIGREIFRAGFTTPELMVYRSGLALLVLAGVVVWSKGGLGQLKTRRPLIHLARNSVHFLGQYAWFSALATAPLALVFALEFTMPLWIALFAPLLIGERLTAPRIAATVIGFAGILVALQPHNLTLSVGAIWGIVAAIAFGLSIIAVKSMTSSEPPLRILVYMMAIQLVMALIVVRGAVPVPGPITWLWLWGAALAGLLSQYAMAKAFALGDTLVIMPIDYVRLPAIAAIGALAYGEPLDPWVLAGGALILAGNYWNLRAERRGGPR